MEADVQHRAAAGASRRQSASRPTGASRSVGLVLLIACAKRRQSSAFAGGGAQQEIAVRAALGPAAGASCANAHRKCTARSVRRGSRVLICVLSVKWMHLLGKRASRGCLTSAWMDACCCLRCRSRCFREFCLALRRVTDFPAGLNSPLKDASRGAAGTSAVWGRGNNVRRLLVDFGTRLSVVLLIGAGLLIRSFASLQNVQPGFEPRDMLTFELTMTGRKVQRQTDCSEPYKQLWERLERLPGASAAGGVTSLPLSQAFAWTPITVEGRTPLPGEKFLNADERLVGGHYFEAMGIPLRRGRFFNEQDDTTKPVAVIVDEYMARLLWPGQDPIGKRIHIVELKSAGPWQTVVGVVAA